MRRLITALIVMWLLMPVCRGAGEEYDLEQYWRQTQSYGISGDITLEQGMKGLWAEALEQVKGLLRPGIRCGVELLAVVLLCGLAEGACVGKTALDAVRLAGALAVTTLSISSVDSMIGLGRETIAAMERFSAFLLPVVAVLTAATGSYTAAAAHQGVTVLFTQLLIQLIDQLLIPMVYGYIAVCCACAAVGNEGLKKLGGMLKGGVTSILTAVLLVFVGYLTLSGAIAGSADAAAVKAAKMAISRTVPVVGGILSDAAEAALVGAGMLRGSVGAAGALVVLAICMVPFLQLAVHYLTYKLTAALVGTVAEARLSALLDGIGGAFGLVLGMTGTCAMMLLFSIVSAVSAVSG